MGSYSSLFVGNICIHSTKSILCNGSELFCMTDKIKKFRPDYSDYEYVLSRKLSDVVPRLELMGYTLENSKKELKIFLKDVFPEYHLDFLINELSKIDFLKTYRYNSLGYLLPDLSDSFLPPLSILRIIAELHKDKELYVFLDYMELSRGGYIKKNNFLPQIKPSFLILTEGKSDTEILQLSLQKLFPYIAPYFTFANIEENPFGGATNLVKFIKGLNCINYDKNILVIFDNDTAGNSAIKELPNNLSSNINVMTLPKHKKFNKFNTIGLSNKICKRNINGLGVAIECFLDIPENAFIRWICYNESLKKYQGCFDTNYKKSYLEKFKNAIRNNKNDYDFSMLEFLWKEIIRRAVHLQKLSYNHTDYFY